MLIIAKEQICQLSSHLRLLTLFPKLGRIMQASPAVHLRTRTAQTKKYNLTFISF